VIAKAGQKGPFALLSPAPLAAEQEIHFPPRFSIHAQVGRYRLRLAQTAEDREDACRLRFRVFNLELGDGLESSYSTGVDTDHFDNCCEHLLVEADGRAVGTYRMQSGATAAMNRGYYSAQEFEFAPDGYLSDSRYPNMLWFQKGGIAEHLTRDL
jgi:putative hemolysin